MLRSQKCLKGEAMEAVRASLVSTNVDKAMKTLERRFGRPEYIVDELTSQVIRMPNVKEDEPMPWIKFADAISNLVTTVESLQSTEMSDSYLLKQLIGKIPTGLKNKWGEAILRNTKKASILEFTKWLEKRADTALAIYERPVQEQDKNKHIPAIWNPEHKNAQCSYREKGHKIENCPQFEKLTVDERWDWVIKKKVCFCCFSQEHSRKDCDRKAGCGKDGCHLKHHRLLHHDRGRQHSSVAQLDDLKCKSETPRPTKPANAEGKERVNLTRRKRKRVPLMILPVTLHRLEGKVDTPAFLDTNSTVILIEEDVAVVLGLSGPTEPLNSQ
ncbi:uncharacterized protein LOC117173704 [Belonocnema kinseyi]|uniref:uncharacterized protein LOC117173704 n=1 Tax=Belonocnema kinseyi TaxID=2817044 RepID=UPI00143DEF30|nr:uncharacterized protein LOC117173704 [Belonocnema kinseyi]